MGARVTQELPAPTPWQAARRARPQLLPSQSERALAAQLADALERIAGWRPTWSAIGRSSATGCAASDGIGVIDCPSRVPPDRVSSWDLIVGVTGLALCRHVLSGPRHRSRQRIDELRAILAAGDAGWEPVPAAELAPRAGYALWAAVYDAPATPIVRAALDRAPRGRARCGLRHRTPRCPPRCLEP